MARLKASKGTFGQKPIEDKREQGPPCPEHGKRMFFSPEVNGWRCPEPGCNKVARPAAETLSDSPYAPEQILNDETEIVINASKGLREVYVHHKPTNVFIPISRYVTGVDIDAEMGMQARISISMIVVAEDVVVIRQ